MVKQLKRRKQITRDNQHTGPVSKKKASVQKPTAPPTQQEAEPSVQELSHEEVMLQKNIAQDIKKQDKLSESNKDLLTNYLEQLSYISLLTPEQEIQYAQDLEQYEVTTWCLILVSPKAVLHTYNVCNEVEPALRNQIELLQQAHQRMLQRSHKRSSQLPPALKKQIYQLAKALRVADFDKELLEKVMAHLRQDVWNRRVISANPNMRITHADLTEIEKSRGIALRARNHFVRANLRLVISVARNFHHYRIPFIDLIQEGNVGLMKAVHRFDHRRGFRFSTYAHWWIRQSIERAIINKGSQVRLPVHVVDSRRQVSRSINQLVQCLGRTPSVVEISKFANLSIEKVYQIMGGIQQDPVSLDDTVNEHDPRKFLDLVRDDSESFLDESLIRENTFERVRELLNLLSPIEKDIIRRRFGIGDDMDQTLDEIGKIYKLSRERVRQIQTQCLSKMRRMCERRKIN